MFFAYVWYIPGMSNGNTAVLDITSNTEILCTPEHCCTCKCTRVSVPPRGSKYSEVDGNFQGHKDLVHLLPPKNKIVCYIAPRVRTTTGHVSPSIHRCHRHHHTIFIKLYVCATASPGKRCATILATRHCRPEPPWGCRSCAPYHHIARTTLEMSVLVMDASHMKLPTASMYCQSRSIRTSHRIPGKCNLLVV